MLPCPASPPQGLRRCVQLLLPALRGPLSFLAAPGPGNGHSEAQRAQRVRCAEALSGVYLEVAALRVGGCSGAGQCGVAAALIGLPGPLCRPGCPDWLPRRAP